MADQRYFVAVDIRSQRGSMAEADRFRARRPEAAIATLMDGPGVSSYLLVLTKDENVAHRSADAGPFCAHLGVANLA